MRCVPYVPLCLSAGLLAGGVGFACAAGGALPYAPPQPVAQPIAPIMAGPNPLAGLKRFEPPRGRVCFNPADTRDKIATLRLTEPFRALRMGRLQGDALRAKLCRWKPDEFVYEVAVLRRDGRVVHLYMNALNGQAVGVPDAEDVGDTTRR